MVARAIYHMILTGPKWYLRQDIRPFQRLLLVFDSVGGIWELASYTAYTFFIADSEGIASHINVIFTIVVYIILRRRDSDY